MKKSDEKQLYEQIHRLGVMVGNTSIVSEAAMKLYYLGAQKPEAQADEWDDETVVEPVRKYLEAV